eukprot:jgi/Psemu1/472/gm1.472_g
MTFIGRDEAFGQLRYSGNQNQRYRENDSALFLAIVAWEGKRTIILEEDTSTKDACARRPNGWLGTRYKFSIANRSQSEVLPTVGRAYVP